MGAVEDATVTILSQVQTIDTQLQVLPNNSAQLNDIMNFMKSMEQRIMQAIEKTQKEKNLEMKDLTEQLRDVQSKYQVQLNDNKHLMDAQMNYKQELSALQDRVKLLDSQMIEAKLEITRLESEARVNSNPNQEQSHVYWCKGEEDVLSNMYRCRIVYKGEEYPSAEHAFQVTKARHVYGPEHDLIERLMSIESPMEVKKVAEEELIFSASWRKRAETEAEEIIRAKLEQVKIAKETLDKTGKRPIKHNVVNSFWGTGQDGKGRNAHGRILMKLRDGRYFDDNNEVGVDDTPEGSSYRISVNKNTECIIIGDSVMNDVDARRFAYGNTLKIKAGTVKEASKIVSELHESSNIKHLVLHVGTNDLSEDTGDHKVIAEDLKQTIKEANIKFPRSTIAYSEVVQKNESKLVYDFNHDIEIFCNINKFRYVSHNMRQHLFNDNKHPNESGTRLMVANIKHALGLYTETARSQSRGRSWDTGNTRRRSGSREYPRGRMSRPRGHFNRRY
jgi:ribA/ribD-fused uncharacterized protein